MNKLCRSCDTEKDISEFSRQKLNKDGYKNICKSCCRDYAKGYYKENKEVILNNSKISYDSGKKKQYHIQNRERINERVRNKRKTDMQSRLKNSLRVRTNLALKGKSKSASTLSLLGCSIEEYRTHLERQFDSNMSWENYGSYWNIDHIKPCSKFDLSRPEEQKECFHYTNTQPMQVLENMRKQDKYD